MKYQIGIMSSKWIVEADSLDVAVVTVRLQQKTTAPVVCYNSKEQSKFAGPEWYTEEELSAFIDEHIDDIRICHRTVEAV